LPFDLPLLFYFARYAAIICTFLFKNIKDRKLIADIPFVTGKIVPAIIKPKEG